MNYIYNITFLLILSSIFSCASTKTIDIGKTETPFYSVDSVFLVTPSYTFSQNNFTLSLEVERLLNVQEYYFPSSEQLRVIIKDAKSKTILNTSESKSFFSAISPVEPLFVGGKKVYAYSHNGVNLFEKLNEIEVYLILPIKPNEIYFNKRIKLKE
ncbi:MAG: hypothetical protein WC121_04220 [Candidatus Kapaibacterium sp.]